MSRAHDDCSTEGEFASYVAASGTRVVDLPGLQPGRYVLYGTDARRLAMLVVR